MTKIGVEPRIVYKHTHRGEVSRLIIHYLTTLLSAHKLTEDTTLPTSLEIELIEWSNLISSGADRKLKLFNRKRNWSVLFWGECSGWCRWIHQRLLGIIHHRGRNSE